MDIARPDLARKKKIRQGAYGVLATVVIVLITFGVQQLQPAAPRVDRNTVYIDTVQRGPMVRQVRGTGTLVPEEIRWIPATTEGNVERIVIDPGAEVTPASVIVELSNPELEQQAQEAELNLRAAETRYENRRVELESDLLLQRATLASVEAALTVARLEAAADAELARDGLVSSLQLERKQATEREQETRFALEQERLRMSETTMAAKLAVEQAEVDRLRALWELRRDQVADLRVRAGMAGVLQQVPLDEGQRVTAGANLARVGDPTVLKAELRIARDAGQGRADRAGGLRRHEERRDCRSRGAHRSGGGERDGDGGRDAGGGAAAGRASGPDGGRDDRARASGRSGLRGAARVRAGGEHGQPFPPERRGWRRLADARPARAGRR